MEDRMKASTLRAICNAVGAEYRLDSCADYSDVVVCYLANGFVYPNDSYNGHPMSTFDCNSMAQYRDAMKLVVRADAYQHVCGNGCGN